MRDHVPCCLRCSGSDLDLSQHILSQAILSLESTSEVYDQFSRQVESNLESIVPKQTSILGQDIKRALEHLHILRDVLFHAEVRQDATISLSEPNFPLQIDRQTRTLIGEDLKNRLYSYLGSNERSFPLSSPLFTKNVLRVGHIQIAEDPIIQIRKKPRAPVVLDIEETFLNDVATVTAPEAQNSACQEMLPHNNFAFLGHASSFLRFIRLSIELRYTETETGIPSSIILDLATFEQTFQIERDQRTDSIWNADHQEHRIEVFHESDNNISYRLKCICPETAVHDLDVYCPRNIPVESSDNRSESGSDTSSAKESKKKKKKQTSACGCSACDPSDEEEKATRKLKREKKRRKELKESREEAMKEIMKLVGLPNAKEHIQKLLAKAKTMARQGIDIKGERYGTVLIGNSGTGKTTFASHYAKLLHGLGVIGSEEVKHTTGIYLADGGISRCKNYIENLADKKGGVMFIDDAHYLLDDNHHGVRVLDYLLGQVDARKGTVVFILAGKEDKMMDVLGHGDKNLSGLLPYHIRFKDYTDEELREILWHFMNKKMDDKAEVEGGKDGLYMRIATKRLGRTRGSTQFANARSVENLLSQILDRQAARLSKARAEKAAAEGEALKALEAAEKKDKDNTTKAADETLDTEPLEAQGLEKMESSENKAEDKNASPAEEETNANLPKAESTLELNTSNVAESEETKATKTEPETSLKDISEGKPDTDGQAPKDDPSNEDLDEIKEKNKFEEASEEKSDEKEEDKRSESGSESEAESEKEEEDDTASEIDLVDEEDYKFTKEDIIGPNPSDAVLESPAWQKMQRLTALKTVKESILGLLELVKTNYEREMEEKPPLKVSLNRLFLGPPGTGKTMVAKLYAQLLAEIGILTKGDVIIKNPSDLIGRYIGDSENNTRAALRSAMGSVFVLDEAYMMYSGGADGTGNESDSFRQGIMDTLVGEIQSEPGEDRCVLLLGYDDAMSEMLQNSNPGLSRRFPMSDAFWFQNFTLEELESILKSKLEDHVLEATEPAIKVAMDVLEKASTRVNFGNGGEVENLITKAKINYQKRMSTVPVPERPKTWIFEPQDFDPEFDRGKTATANLKELFKDVIGCEDIIAKLEQYQHISQTMKLRGLDPKDFIPTNFVFKGPPGTGKTTTARKIAQVYYDMGHLAEPSVVECSASDLIGKYVGHSGPKTVKVFERALGRVLFIDEAYRLASGKSSCSFNSEVISELVDLLTKPKYAGKLIVILAGYSDEMNSLLSTNPGLASRFPEEIHFPSLGPDHCLEILKIKLAKTGILCPILSQPRLSACKSLVRKMRFLSETKGWGNARDVETLAKGLAREAFGRVKGVDDILVCTADMVGNALDRMASERRARGVVKEEGAPQVSKYDW